MDKNVIAVLMVFGIPIVAIIAGVTVGIVKMVSRHRIVELAYRERIAAIERGADVGALPPLSGGGEILSQRQAALQSGRGLLTSGLVSLGTGIGLCLTFVLMPETNSAWPLGIIPACVGIALLISARISRRTADEAIAPPTQ